jgi:hypothetical protein
VTGLYGVYRGVVQSFSDPNKQNRLQILVPQIGPTFVTGWANPSTPGGGTTQTPSVGATVWVLFEGGDPEWPTWMSQPVPYAPPTPISGAVVKKQQQSISLSADYAGTTQLEWWSWSFQKTYSGTRLLFEYAGSSYNNGSSGVIGYAEYHVGCAAPVVNDLLVHFYFNTQVVHASQSGSSLTRSFVGSSGPLLGGLYVSCGTANAPIWTTDGNDFHSLVMTELW